MAPECSRTRKIAVAFQVKKVYNAAGVLSARRQISPALECGSLHCLIGWWSLWEMCQSDFLLRLLEPQKMPQGKIKKIISEKGFGFIEAPQGDLFFHHSEVKVGSFDHLQEGDVVEFTVGTGKKGPCANAVRPVK